MEYVLRQKQDLSPYLRRCKTLQLSPDYIIPHDVDEETTHSTIVEGDEHTGSSDSERLSLPCTRFQIMNRKASWPCISATSPAAASDVHTGRNMSRRKGVPHRSPLCWEMVIPAVQPISSYLSPSFLLISGHHVVPNYNISVFELIHWTHRFVVGQVLLAMGFNYLHCGSTKQRLWISLAKTLIVLALWWLD